MRRRPSSCNVSPHESACEHDYGSGTSGRNKKGKKRASNSNTVVELRNSVLDDERWQALLNEKLCCELSRANEILEEEQEAEEAEEERPEQVVKRGAGADAKHDNKVSSSNAKCPRRALSSEHLEQPVPEQPQQNRVVLKHQRWGDFKEKEKRHMKWLSPSFEKNHRPVWWPMLTPHIVADKQLKEVVVAPAHKRGQILLQQQTKNKIKLKYSGNNADENSENGGEGSNSSNDEIRLKRVHFASPESPSKDQEENKPEWWPGVLPYVCAQPELPTSLARQREKRVIHRIPNRKDAPAIQIQAIARGWYRRVQYRRLRLRSIERRVDAMRQQPQTHATVTKLQAVIRGWICRQNYRTLLTNMLQDMARNICELAALQIQNAVRGWQCRVRYGHLRQEKRADPMVAEIAALLRRLSDVEVVKQSELNQIEEKKLQTMDSLQQEHANARKESVRLDRLLESQAAQLETNEAIRQELIAANAAFEQQNRELSAKCDELRRQSLEIPLLQSEIALLLEDNETLRTALEEQRENVVICKTAIELRDMYSASEKRIAQNYDRSIRRITKHIRGNCTQDELIGEVCNNNNNSNNTGTDTTTDDQGEKTINNNAGD